MPLQIGTAAIGKIYVGSAAVSKVYIGADLVADFSGGAPAPFTDNFNRSDENVEANANWTLVSGGSAGAAKISSNQVAFFGTSVGGGAYLCPDLSAADHYVQVVRKVGNVDNGSCFFIAVRVTDLNNWIAVRQFGGGNWQLKKRIAGTETLVASAGVSFPASGDVLRLEVSGTSVTVKFNGGTVIGPTTISDAAVQGVTRAGFVVQSGTGADSNPILDDFEAGAL